VLVPHVWIEQTTCRLQGGCSTTELMRHSQDRGDGRSGKRQATPEGISEMNCNMGTRARRHRPATRGLALGKVPDQDRGKPNRDGDQVDPQHVCVFALLLLLVAP
jgi:hypothetical protein